MINSKQIQRPQMILVVDDQEINRDLLCDILEGKNYELIYAENGKEALEQNNFLVKMTEIIGVEMNDAPGGLTSVLKIIRDNNIDLEYLYAFTHDKADKAILLLHSSDIDKLIEVLENNNITIVKSEEVYNL